MIPNIINHIVLVLDASLSMTQLTGEVTKVADNQIQYLAQRSKEMDQETRITVYTFATRDYNKPKIDCLIYDKDVLRVPSIAGLYRAGGNTPLIDATFTALDDLAMTPEKYGEHSFLIYVLTDGQENMSKQHSAAELSRKIQSLPEHWTVATFVPNQVAVHEAKRFGFPAQNISVWDTTSVGVAEVGTKIRETTEAFMQARTTGVRGSRNLFTLGAPSLDVVSKTLGTPLHHGQFRLLDISNEHRIDEFVERSTGRAYRRGEAYYQLSKSEKVQPQKSIAILGKQGLFTGPDARKILGLPDFEVRVSPTHSTDYTIFVQSTSNNRKLVPNTRLLLMS